METGLPILLYEGSDLDLWRVPDQATNIINRPKWGIYRSYNTDAGLQDEQEDLHRTKLRFFTNITHEIRTPLTLMIGSLESIRNNGDVKGAMAARLLMVEKNSRRLLQLVNQLLSFRKLTGERETLQLDGQDLVAFCRGIVASFEELARDRQIDLEFSSAEPMLVVGFDPDKMEKVLYNLLGNACNSPPPVARRVGYRDVKYFSKSFRVAHGCSPSAYRERSEKELKSG